MRSLQLIDVAARETLTLLCQSFVKLREQAIIGDTYSEHPSVLPYNCGLVTII